MRKRNITKIADTIFWYTLYMLPLLSYLVWIGAVCRNAGLQDITPSSIRSVLNFSDFLALSRFETLHDNIIFTTLFNVFGTGTGSVFRIFNSDILMIFSWFIGVYLVHLFVDVILFIPRFAIKWMDEFTQE